MLDHRVFTFGCNVKRYHFIIILLILLAFACSFSPFSARQWKLSPGDIRETPEKEDWFFRGKSLYMSRTTVPGGGTYEHPATGADVVRIVLDGALENTVGDTTIRQNAGDCLYLAHPGTHRYRASGAPAEFMDIHFTAGNGCGAASVSSGEVIASNRLQFCQPEHGIDARIIETPSGQVAFVRMERDMSFPARTGGVEQLLYVTRGKMTVTVDGKKRPMTTGDILILDGNSRVSFETGPRGCDVIAAFTPGRRDYSKALADRMAAYHTIVAPGTEPVLLVDGDTSQPGLTFTEGPSWMNGRFYFSNYYKFWKPWGSSDEGGVWVVEEDGSYRVLNKNVQTCGTTPLYPMAHSAFAIFSDARSWRWTPKRAKWDARWSARTAASRSRSPTMSSPTARGGSTSPIPRWPRKARNSPARPFITTAVRAKPSASPNRTK